MIPRMAVWTVGLLLGSTLSARAGLIIAIDDAALRPGATATLNATISNTGPDPVDIDSFAFRFQISTAGPTQLAFTPAQADPFNRADYLFYDNSLDQSVGTSLGSVGTTVTPNDAYAGGDDTNDGNEVVLGGSKYLVSLQVTTQTGVPPTPGNLFTIGLAATDPQGNLATYFSGDQGNLDYQVTGGIVTIVGVTANMIPEPASWLMMGSGTMLSLGLIRLHRRPAR